MSDNEPTVYAAYDGPPVTGEPMKTKALAPRHATDGSLSVPLPSQDAIDSASPGVFWLASKFHVQTAVSFVIAMLSAMATFGHFDHKTAVPIIIALSTALLTWLTPRVSTGVLAYTKLGVALVGAVAQIVVPVAFTGGWSASMLPVVAVAAYGAFQTWLVPDAKSRVGGPVRTV